MNDVFSGNSPQISIVTTIPYLKKSFTESEQRYIYPTHPKNLAEIFNSQIRNIAHLRQTLIKQYPKLFNS